MQSDLRPYTTGDVTRSVADERLAPRDAEIRLVEWIAPRGGEATPMLVAPVHVHWRDDETWYVLEGRLSLLLGDRIVSVESGGAATAVRGTRHTYWNPDPVPCRYLLAMPPRIADLIASLHDGESGDMAETFRRFDSELLGGWELPTLDA